MHEKMMYENKINLAAPRRTTAAEESDHFGGRQEACAGRQSQTAEAFGSLENSLAGLSMRMESLQERLHPVLRPEPVSPSKESASTKLMLAPIAETTRMLDSRVVNIMLRVEDMLNRLEL